MLRVQVIWAINRACSGPTGTQRAHMCIDPFTSGVGRGALAVRLCGSLRVQPVPFLCFLRKSVLSQFLHRTADIRPGDREPPLPRP